MTTGNICAGNTDGEDDKPGEGKDEEKDVGGKPEDDGQDEDGKDVGQDKVEDMVGDVGGDPASGSAAVSPAKTAADPTSPVDATPERLGKRAAEPFVLQDDEEIATPSKTPKTAEENEAAEKEKQAAKRK